MKFATLVLALAMSLNISIPFSVENFDTTDNNQRIAYGMAYKTYCENENTYSVELITEDGNIWTINDYICNPCVECIVVFDTQGTENLEDDTIISIVTYTNFSE